MAEFFETRIEYLEKLIPSSVQEGSRKRKVVTFDNSDDEDSDVGHSGKKLCQYHGTCEHTMDQCTTLKALVKQTKQKKSKHFDNKKRFNKHEVNVMVQKQVKKALKQKKRKHTEEQQGIKNINVSDSDQE